MKNILIIGGVVALLLIGGVWWSQSLQSNDPNVVSTRGLHTHPQLAIYVRGEKIDIPHDIGVGPKYQNSPGYGQGGMMMTPMHTHDDIPVIHLEYQGRVLKEDVTLGRFFSVWGKDMRSFGSNMHMTVNGKENTEYENYMMKDGDIIELRYE